MKSKKSELRKELLKKRQGISEDIWEKKSREICQNLELLELFQKANTIASYFSFRKEVDLLSLTANNIEKKWVFPRCENNNLIWHLWTPKDKLKQGIYGIQEPYLNLPIITPDHIDLILVPALACDYQGYRLGYGGGYYDRMLKENHWQKIPRFGIIFESFYFPHLPSDFWDQKLDFICTENAIYSIPK